MPDVRFCRQPGLGILRVSGRDARKFLHAQTTQQIDDLKPQETRLAAWLNAKGRVLALFDVVPDGDGYLLILPADNVGAVIAGLRRYVLRDDVRIESAADCSVLCVIGAVDDWLGERGIALPRQGVAAAGDAILARTGERRVDVIAAAPPLPPVLAGLAEADADAAALVAIAEGRPDMPAVLADRYTPHMLNLERNAVSFTKGCYPGQEIVARTEHRGEAKRGIRRLASPTGTRPLPGDAIVDAAGALQGEVNRAAAADGGFEILAVAGVGAGVHGLHLADGRALAPLPI
jgi:folate-binding protein YgfZ